MDSILLILFVTREIIIVSNKGKLIAFSGIDGSGKSTLCKNVYEYYADRKCNVEYISVFEERTFISEYVKITNEDIVTSKTVISESLKNISWLCDLVNNVLTILVPKSDSGTTVFVDRYTLCAKVYSLATTSKDISSLFPIYNILPKPDLCFYLNINPLSAVKRIDIRNKKKTYYENINDLQKIQAQYESMIPYEDYKVEKLDALKSENALLSETLHFIDKIKL